MGTTFHLTERGVELLQDKFDYDEKSTIFKRYGICRGSSGIIWGIDSHSLIKMVQVFEKHPEEKVIFGNESHTWTEILGILDKAESFDHDSIGRDPC